MPYLYTRKEKSPDFDYSVMFMLSFLCIKVCRNALSILKYLFSYTYFNLKYVLCREFLGPKNDKRCIYMSGGN